MKSDMKNKYKKLGVFSAIAVLNVSALHAQEVMSSVQERKCLLNVITLIEDYEFYSTLSDNDEVYSFKDLFLNESVLVYNDLPGLAKGQKLKVSEYVDCQYKKAKAQTFTIKNLKKDKIWRENGVWKVQCSFDKEVSYYNNCGVWFASKELYNIDYNLTAVLVYDENDNTCKFESIDGSIKSDYKLPEDFVVFKSEDKRRDGRLLYKGLPIRYNDHEQAFMEVPVLASDFQYNDPDVLLIPKAADECGFMSMGYKARRWTLKPHVDIALGHYYTSDSFYPINAITESSKGTEFGVDLGYTIPSKGKVKFSLNFGLGMSSSKFSQLLSDYEYTYSAGRHADVDGDEYKRHYENVNVMEKNSFTHLTLPLYFDVDWRFSKMVSFYVQAGVKNYMKLGSKLSQYNGNYYVWGEYGGKYGNLRLDENWGFNGFGTHQLGETYVSADFPMRTFAVDAIGGGGFRFNLSKKAPVSLELGVTYQKTINDMWDATSGSALLVSGKENSGNAIFTYTVNGGERVRMLNESLSDLKRNHLSLKIGVNYKF